MKAGIFAIILGALISLYPMFLLAVCLGGASLGGDAVIASSAFAIIGVIFICTGLILKELAKQSRQ